MTAIHTPRETLVRGGVTGCTATAITAPTTTSLTKPVTALGTSIVIPCGHNHTKLFLGGVAAANATAHVRLDLWTPVTSGSVGVTESWMSNFIGTFLITIGGYTGLSGTGILETERIADQIVDEGTTAYDTIAIPHIRTPSADSQAWMLIDTLGDQLLEMRVNRDAGTGASCTDVNLWAQRL